MIFPRRRKVVPDPPKLAAQNDASDVVTDADRERDTYRHTFTVQNIVTALDPLRYARIRRHDVETSPRGNTIHYATCWCRTEYGCTDFMGDAAIREDADPATGSLHLPPSPAPDHGRKIAVEWAGATRVISPELWDAWIVTMYEDEYVRALTELVWPMVRVEE